MALAAAHPCGLLRGGSLLAAIALLALSYPAANREAFASDEPLAALAPRLILTGSEPGIPFQSPRGVALNLVRGEILVANTGRGRVEVFNLEGRAVGRFIHRVVGGDGVVAVGRPRGLALDSKGNLLVLDDRARYVDVVDSRGRARARLDFPGEALARRYGPPAALAIMPDGRILVASGGDSGRVFVHSPDYEPLGSWGEPGTSSGQLSRITGIAATPSGEVVVTCAATDLAVQIFDRSQRFVRGFGRHDLGDENFSMPSAVVVTSDGRIWVSDEIRQVIKIFNLDGGFLGMVGGGGVAPGEFQYPSALASDGTAHLAVAERVGNRIQLLRLR